MGFVPLSLNVLGASFTEMFYGLKRVHRRTGKDIQTHSRGILMSLIELVVYPVVKSTAGDHLSSHEK
jgi:hypothetical protein